MNLTGTSTSLCVVLLIYPALAVSQPRVNEGAALIQKFEERVSEYVKARNAARNTLPALPPHDKKQNILEYQRLWAARIGQVRSTAQQGDICSPDIAAELRRLIALAMQGPDAARILKSLRNAEPVSPGLGINKPFPDGMPIQSTPPTLLLNLPRLPAELDYRLVGRALVLRDTGANIIVDFFPDAMPIHP